MDHPGRTRRRMVGVTVSVLALLGAEWYVMSDMTREGSQTAVLNLAIPTTALGVALNLALLARLRAEVRTSTRRVTARLQGLAPGGSSEAPTHARYVVVSAEGATLYHLPQCQLVAHKPVRWTGGPREPSGRACGVCLDA